MQFLLERAGAKVLVAGTTAEALQILDAACARQPSGRAPFDVILSDIGLPDVDGFDFMKAVRGRAANRGGTIPSVALTAFTRAVDSVRSMQAGFQAHVPKPIDFDELNAVIRSLVVRA